MVLHRHAVHPHACHVAVDGARDAACARHLKPTASGDVQDFTAYQGSRPPCPHDNSTELRFMDHAPEGGVCVLGVGCAWWVHTALCA